MKKFVYVILAASVGLGAISCAHRNEFKMGEKSASTEADQKGVTATVAWTKYRKDEVHFLVTLQNFYSEPVETTYDNFTFTYGGMASTIYRNEFPPVILANQGVQKVLIFKFPAQLPLPGTGVLTISPKLKSGKKVKPIVLNFEYSHN